MIYLFMGACAAMGRPCNFFPYVHALNFTELQPKSRCLFRCEGVAFASLRVGDGGFYGSVDAL